MRLLNRLGLKPHPACGRQNACTIPLPSGKMPPPSSEVRDAPKEVEVTGPGVALALTSSKEPAKESDHSGVAETNEGQNPDAPQETIGFTDDASISFAEGPVLLVEPLQSVPLGEGSKDLETSPAQLSKVGVEATSKE